MQDRADTDEALLARYRAGDPSALDALVDRYGRSVYAFIHRTLGPEAAAEDLAQEVWLRVIRGVGRFDGRARFSTWLFQVARNACLDHLRRRRRHPPPARADSETASGLDGLAAPGPSILERVSGRELGALVDEAVRELPAPQREVFLLREHTPLTFGEIGELLGVPRETVKSRMRYALAAVRRAVRRRIRAEASSHGL
ncbi:MAG: sigma-70 family RNA polymerase sigma factor [Planctomycetota bacterium]|nr:MAG: sigma-70 family RNA polymerase sigma factor [Planctomycetota bacterium]